MAVLNTARSCFPNSRFLNINPKILSSYYLRLPWLRGFRGLWPLTANAHSPCQGSLQAQGPLLQMKMQMDSFPHFSKRWQHKMVPFLPLKVLCLIRWLELLQPSHSQPEEEVAHRWAESKGDLREAWRSQVRIAMFHGQELSYL